MCKNKTLIEIYEALLKNQEVDTQSLSSDFILDCFLYGYLKDKPSKSHKKWFKEAFNCDYPVYISDIPKSVIKELKGCIKHRKENEKWEEKQKMQRYKRGYSDSDCWNINSWFLNIMPKMLKQMKDNLHGYPAGITSILIPNNQAVSDTVLDNNAEEEPGFIKWQETLDRMIFLLKEMNEDTCSYNNPYKKEYEDMNNDFRNKYGLFGEELRSKKEKEDEKKKRTSRVYFPSDFPELYPEAAELSHNYFLHEQYKSCYMDKCREEFFFLFSKHFWDLWD